MATTLTSTVQLSASWNHIDTDASGRAATDNAEIKQTTNYTNGTGDGQQTKIYHDQLTVNDAADLDLDLSGSLTDKLGNTVQFTKVKSILVKNLNTATGENLIMGGSAANAFQTHLGGTNPSISIGPKGAIGIDSPLDGYAVTAGTGDILRFTGSGGNITFDVVIEGI